MAGLAATRRGNFTGDPATGGVTNNVSYSFVNVYPSTAAMEKGYKLSITDNPSDFAIAADLSPAAPADPLWQAVQPTAKRSDIIRGNTRNHDQDGQNVLYADGHTEFQQAPFCGTEGDNIYAARTGTADPADAIDTVLLIHQP